MTRSEDIRRFFSKARRDERTGCLIWIGCTDAIGRGWFKWRRRGKRAAVDVRRVAWELSREKAPVGDVSTTCRNTLCVEATHLHVGIQLHPAGEHNGAAVLTWAEVTEIRIQHAAGVARSRLAHLFNVHRSTIRRIVFRLSWLAPPES